MGESLGGARRKGAGDERGELQFGDADASGALEGGEELIGLFLIEPAELIGDEGADLAEGFDGGRAGGRGAEDLQSDGDRVEGFLLTFDDEDKILFHSFERLEE